ncbi:hypothetical protein ACP4OV_029233 [Aristida adscensionis]
MEWCRNTLSSVWPYVKHLPWRALDVTKEGKIISQYLLGKCEKLTRSNHPDPPLLAMAPAAAAAAAVVLGDDLLREVFLRLPAPEDLVRAAAACKPFLSAARSGPFLRRFRRLHPSSCPRLLGCLLLLPGRRRAPRLLPTPAAAAAATGHAGDFSLSFLPGGWLSRWFGSGSWQLLDCRNGRLLLRKLGTQQLAVADPVARRCVSLPAPPVAEPPVGYGLVADDADSSEFGVVCVSRDAAASALRALVLSSGELAWAEAAALPCQLDPAAPRAMQASRSLYWTLHGGERMVAFSTVTMAFSVLELPPTLRQLSFDVIEKRDDGDRDLLHLLTMRGFCVEVWAAAAGGGDGGNGVTWRRLEKSVRFHTALARMIQPSVEYYQHRLDVVGVAAGVVFVRLWGHLISISMETMKLEVLSKASSEVLIYPYAIAWPPSFLHPAAEGQDA